MPAEDLDDTDYELRNSQIEEFPEENGDFIDLDAQDHILIETTDSNERIDELEVVPEEFTEANTRNIVDRNNMELTTISEKTSADSNTTRSRENNSSENQNSQDSEKDDESAA